MRIRAGVPADAEALARLLVEGFEGYRGFAAPGWDPPRTVEEEAEHLRGRLDEPDVWCGVAEEGGEVAGYVAFLPAAHHRRGSDDPGLAHVFAVFVRPPHWGTGLASRLLADAVAAAAERGFRRMRLFTPARQARARRFYEREGWEPVGAPFDEPKLGLELVEYRRPVP